MTLAAIRPSDDPLDVMGNVSYSDGYGARNTIWLKKDVLKEFPAAQGKNCQNPLQARLLQEL